MICISQSGDGPLIDLNKEKDGKQPESFWHASRFLRLKSGLVI